MVVYVRGFRDDVNTEWVNFNLTYQDISNKYLICNEKLHITYYDSVFFDIKTCFVWT